MNMPFSVSAVLLALATSAVAAPPPPAEDAARLRQLATSHLAQRTDGIPGEVKLHVALPSATKQLTRCEAPEAFIPDGVRLAGRVTVGIRCHAPAKWTTYLRAEVSIMVDYLVAATALKPGQLLTPELLETRRGDLSTLAQDVISQTELATGKIMTTGLAAGAPLRSGMMRAPQAVAQGQGITLVVNGNGFRISSEGRALNNAADGQVVQVRTASGQVISGIARSGGLVDLAN